MKLIGCFFCSISFIQAVSSQELLRSLAPRFTPDPIVLEGQVEGVVPLGEVIRGRETRGNCSGFTRSQPTYVLPLRNSFAYLSLKVRGEGVMMMVQGPDGIFCRQHNGELSGMWAAGVYQIWIGTRQQTRARYRLTLSETDQ